MDCEVDPKHSTMDDDLRMLEPRPYQLEMLDESLKRNVIVTMDTGSGKTHVAVLRIQQELQRCRPDQIVWFLAPKVALSEQQYKVLKKALATFDHRFLCGADGVEKWSTQELWDSVLLNVRVVVCTPQVLFDALTHGFVRMSRIALMVFDEAHNCTGKGPMNSIMSEFYVKCKERNQSVPSILGLTASPVRQLKLKLIQDIERNLDATIISPQLHRSDLLSVVNRPETSCCFYDPDPLLPDSALLQLLRIKYESYDMNNDPSIQELKRANPSKMDEILTGRKEPYCSKQLKSLLLRAEELQVQIGPYAVDWYIKKCSSNLDEICEEENQSLLLDCDFSEKTYLQNLLHAIIHEGDMQANLNNRKYRTEKFQRLLSMLISNVSSGFTGIIFAKQRATVAALVEFLSTTSSAQQHLSVGSFVGSSLGLSRRANVSDLADLKGQGTLLDAFRSGDINLIVSTDVLEEGIDVPACNLVICFDYPQNLTSFIQRRGRARQQESKYVVFFSSESSKVREWQTAEQRLADIYADEDRKREEELDAENCEESSNQILHIESTGARLTLDTALSHLFHFCSTLRRQYVDAKPKFLIIFAEDGKTRCAKVVLPSSIDSQLRIVRSQYFWVSERRAKQDAAFVAYQQLYAANLVNDHLLPVTYPGLEEEETDGTRLNSLLQAADLYDPWLEWLNLWKMNPTQCFSTKLSLEFTNERSHELLLVSPATFPQDIVFKLFWDSNIPVNAILRPSERIEKDQIQDIRGACRLLVRTVFPNHQIKDDTDFILSFCPNLGRSRLQQWFSQNLGPKATISLNTDKVIDKIVYDSERLTVPCIASNIELAIPSNYPSKWKLSSESDPTAKEQMCIALQRLPKLRNFLKPLTHQGRAVLEYRKPRYVPIERCETNGISADLAISTRLIPSVMRHLKNVLIAKELQTTVLHPVGLHDTEQVLHAICAPAAGESFNYERLEHLGDCVLKMLSSIHLMAAHPQKPEAQLSMLKSRLVSNQNLARAAVAKGLDRFIIVENPPMDKWRPLYIHQFSEEHDGSKPQRTLSMKTIADVVESLIGAAFLEGHKRVSQHKGKHTGQALEGGLNLALDCIKLFLPDKDWQTLPSLRNLVFKSAMPPSDLTEQLTNKLAQEQLHQAETLLGHTFTHHSLLTSALTHPSYNQDLTQPTYDRLEFLGDALLDLLITSTLFLTYSHLPHHRMHNLRECAVNQYILSHHNLRRTISVARKDVKPTSPKSNRSPSFEIATTSSTHTLWHYLLRDLMNMSLTDALAKAEDAHAALAPRIDAALTTGAVYPWCDLFGLGAPKCVSDIMESALAAVWLDGGDGGIGDAFDAMVGLLARFGVSEMLHRLARDDVECRGPKERLGILAKSESVEYAAVSLEGAGGTAAGQLKVSVAGVELARMATPRVVRSEVMDEGAVGYVNESRLAEKAIAMWDDVGGGAEIVKGAKERRAAEAQATEAGVGSASTEGEREVEGSAGKEGSEGKGGSREKL